MVFIRVVENSLSFQILLVPRYLEVYNSSYGQNTNRGAHTFLGCAHKIGQQLQGELRCAHVGGLCAQLEAASKNTIKVRIAEKSVRTAGEKFNLTPF